MSKTVIATIFLSLWILSACNKTSPKLSENQYLITGKVLGLEGPCLMYVTDTTRERGFRVDSIPVDSQGQFRYIGLIDTLDFLRFYPGNDTVRKSIDERSYLPSRASQFNFFAYPGAEIHFDGEITDFVDAYPAGGDKMNEDLSLLHSALMPLVNDVVNLRLSTYLDEKADTAMINRKVEEIEERQMEIKKSFYATHFESVTTAMYVLEDFQRDRISLEETVNFLKPLKETAPNKYTDELIKRIYAASSSLPGLPAPPIVTDLTRDSTSFDLASLKGRYVVLDFWGTWCMPCIEGMPEMKKYWKKYADRMEIVGIAQDRNQKVWREFLDKNTYDWIHIFNGVAEEDFVAKYNVNAYPTKVVIDPQGMIVERFVGESNEFYIRLEEILDH